MPSLYELQQQFSDALLHNGTAIHDQILEDEKLTVGMRMELYSSGYLARLKECMESDHSVLAAYLGDELFDKLSREYPSAHPSTCTSLRDFCNQLPAFLQHAAPWSDHPIVAELASFERTLLAAFDAADAQRAETEQLEGLPQEDWPEMRLVMHPSLRLFEADWNSVESWQALKADQAPPIASMNRPPGHWVIWRDRQMLTRFRSLSADERLMFEAVISGDCFAEVCERLLTLLPSEEVAARAVSHLSRWLGEGMISRLESAAR